MVVRPPRSADRARLVEALRSDATFTDEEVAVALELIDAALEEPDGDYLVRVAELPDVPVAGYVCFGHTPMTQSTFDLYWIVTHARARGRGVASGLIRAMEDEVRARGGTHVRVETSEQESHGPARRLYARLDYPEAARFADFYSPGDDLIVYYKGL